MANDEFFEGVKLKIENIKEKLKKAFDDDIFKVLVEVYMPELTLDENVMLVNKIIDAETKVIKDSKVRVKHIRIQPFHREDTADESNVKDLLLAYRIARKLDGRYIETLKVVLIIDNKDELKNRVQRLDPLLLLS